MKRGYTRFAAASAALACALACATAAQAEVYRWTDENGVTHFSQTPPPAGQEAEIEDVPQKASEEVPPGAGIDFDGSGVINSGEMSAADLKRQELAQTRDQRQAEQQALIAACQETRARLAQIEPSRRVYYTNEEGETVRMDDEARADEVDQLHRFIDTNCP